MTFTPTPPTLIGCYYWVWGKGATNGEAISVFNIEGKLCVWESVQQRFVPIKEFGGEWGGRVPAPGTSFTVEQIEEYIRGQLILSAVDGKESARFKQYNQAVRHICNELSDKEDGIAATTARHRKDQGHG